MKKWGLVLVTVYFLLLVVIMFTVDRPSDQVEILTFLQDRSLLIDERENYVIDLAVSSKDTFLTDIDEMESMILDSEEASIEVHPVTMTMDPEPFIYVGKQYYLYELTIGFTEVYLPEAVLGFPGCKMKMTYRNGTEIELEIGNLAIWFSEVSEITYLDFTRLYGIKNNYAGHDYLAGIVIELKANAIGYLEITDIDIGQKQAYIDLNNAKILSGRPEYDVPMDVLLEATGYDPLARETKDGDPIMISESAILVAPVTYQEFPLFLDRFFIRITYKYLNETNVFLIDDFLFYRNVLFSGEDDETIARYIYQY